MKRHHIYACVYAGASRNNMQSNIEKQFAAVLNAHV
jgi:hypothetical protein